LKKLLSFLAITCLAAATFAAQTITWTDYASNPLTIPIPAGFSRAYMPTVVYNASWAKPYKMWCDVSSYAGIIAVAESSDGITWTSLGAGTCTGIDTTGSRPNVIYVPTAAKPYRMYYTTNVAPYPNRTAVSSDGITFSEDTPTFSTGGQWSDGHAVCYDNGVYHMIVQMNSSFAHATSYDGISFSTTGIAPAMTGITDQPSCLIKVGNNDWRLFSYSSNTALRYSTSTDGITFTSAEFPISTVGSTGAAGTWNSSRNYFCSVVYIGNGNFKMWRSGATPSPSVYKIGYATGYDASAVSEWSTY
jgi:hypothetical protein